MIQSSDGLCKVYIMPDRKKNTIEKFIVDNVEKNTVI